jgi:hypothetical protein
LLAVTLLAAGVLTAGNGLAADGSGFGLRPAHSDPRDLATRAYFKRTLKPGDSFGDQVLVSNNNASPMDFLVYPVDGMTGASSGALYANRQDPLKKAGAWVKPEVDRVTVPAHAEKAVAFTVQVPQDASPGDHLAGLAFENANPETSQGQFSVTRILRGVTGILLRVEGQLVKPFQLQIGDLGLRPAAPGTKSASVSIQLANQGQLFGKPYLNVTIDGPSGYHRSIRRQLDSILPGDTIRYAFPWPDSFASGRYHVCVAGGEGDRQQASKCADLTVNLPGGAAGQALNALPRVSPGASPWLTAVLFLGGLLLGGLVVAFLSRRRGAQASR